MGNCLERLTYCQEGETTVKQLEQEEEERRSSGGFVKEYGCDEKGVFRVKIVLTKEELEWLMFQLKDSEEGKRLGDVLGEMEKARLGKAEGWKPSLESIMESPEVHDQMDREIPF